MWIQSHQELSNHPKLRRLRRQLALNKQEAIGYLHLLWWWGMDYAPHGTIIPPYDVDDIADAAEWDGNATAFVDALIDSGFLDREESGRISFHDWAEYGGKLQAKRDAERARKAKARENKKNANS